MMYEESVTAQNELFDGKMTEQNSTFSYSPAVLINLLLVVYLLVLI